MVASTSICTIRTPQTAHLIQVHGRTLEAARTGALDHLHTEPAHPDQRLPGAGLASQPA
jgi:hypothetical protein